MSKYRRDDTPPETLNQMLALMGKPAPPIADPTTLAVGLIWNIYTEMKQKVLFGDKQIESIVAAVKEARERTATEVVHKKLRKNAVAKYDTMLARLAAGGEVQL